MFLLTLPISTMFLCIFPMSTIFLGILFMSIAFLWTSTTLFLLILLISNKFLSPNGMLFILLLLFNTPNLALLYSILRFKLIAPLSIPTTGMFLKSSGTLSKPIGTFLISLIGIAFSTLIWLLLLFLNPDITRLGFEIRFAEVIVPGKTCWRKICGVFK